MEDSAISSPENEASVEETKARMKLRQLANQVGISLDEVDEKNLSRKHLKRIQKKQKWESLKEERRKVAKEKRRNKKKLSSATPRIITAMKDSPNKLVISIDLSYNSYMKEKERRKLLKQIQRCYSINRQSPEPCQLYLSSFTGETKEDILQKQPGFKSWDIHTVEEHFLEAFGSRKDQLVFLSSDSPNLLPKAEELKSVRNERIFIVGGLVDHNVHKGLTLGLAEKAGLQHARLPIDEYVKLHMTKVLTVNHVFELMLLASTGVNWEEAFKKVIPQRKFKTDSVNTNNA